MKAYTGLWVCVATIAGAIGYLRLADLLDRAYRPFADDMHAWIFFAVPTALILSGITASSIASCVHKNYRAAIVKSVPTGLAVGFLYCLAFKSTSTLYDARYALSESGPALMWCASLVLFGVFLGLISLSKRVK